VEKLSGHFVGSICNYRRANGIILYVTDGMVGVCNTNCFESDRDFLFVGGWSHASEQDPFTYTHESWEHILLKSNQAGRFLFCP